MPYRLQHIAAVVVGLSIAIVPLITGYLRTTGVSDDQLSWTLPLVQILGVCATFLPKATKPPSEDRIGLD